MSKMLAFFMFCVMFCGAFEFPSYLTKCKFNDVSMAQCLRDNLPKIKPHLKDGIKELYIPSIAPFHVDAVLIDAGQNLKIQMTDLDIHNLDTFELKELSTKLDDYIVQFVYYFETIAIIGTYDIEGQVLILPIKGHGPANITLHQFDVEFQYKYRPIEKNGVKYINLSDPVFKFKSGKISMHLSNLFNGDKTLGDQMNAFLNENWRDVEELLRPGVTKIVTTIVSAVLDAFTTKIPLENLFIV